MRIGYMKIGINGLGRIGRAVYRLMWGCTDIECVNINEPFATIEDIVYFLKYDSQYGCFSDNIDIIDENTIRLSNQYKTLFTHISHFENVSEYCEILDKEVYVIESSGKPENVLYYKRNITRKVIFTLSCLDIPTEIILGVNENKLARNSSNVISGSICDTVAIAPVLKAVYECSYIKQTLITTMHPVLTYQKAIDNYTDKGIDRVLGRQYSNSIIPKHTSAQTILQKIFTDKIINCFSFRIPTESVCAAVIIFVSDSSIDSEKIIDSLKRKEGISFCNENLVSIDFKGNTASAIVDMRWLEKIDDSILRMAIWYDNEYGYASKIIDVLKLWDSLNC